MRQSEVLIVGAGPTGLALALWLTRLGVRVRIIDENESSGETSRAFAVQARSLELYDQIGLADAAIARGRKITVMNAHRQGGKTARIQFGDFGRGISAFPFMLMLLQDQHEKLLIAHLGAAGVEVERNTALVDLKDEGSTVTARLRRSSGAFETCQAAYLCGCDGVNSAVRELIEASFDGVSDEATFYVADVEASGALIDGEMHHIASSEGLVCVFPLRGENRVRLIGLVPKSVSSGVFQITFEDLAGIIDRETGLRPWLIEWFSTYLVHHRIASAFRKGRVFLLGDAAHVWSPAASQGLNTGLGDAVNLAWKLAWVLQGRAAPALLDTFESERKAVARLILRTTDLAFRVQAGSSPLAKLSRDALAAWAPSLMALQPLRRLFFLTISQVALGYRGGPLSVGKAGRLAGGDRLPWIAIAGGGDNFAPLRTLDWHAQVHGRAEAVLTSACARLGMALHEFAWTSAARRAGFLRNAIYLVRPDGYLAFVAPAQDTRGLENYVSTLGLRPAASSERTR